MKKILVVFVCLICNSSFSQEMVKSVDLGISKNADVFQIVEQEKKQVSLFFSAKKNVLSVRFDDNFNVIDSLKTERPSNDYNDIIGYSLTGNKYYTYWSSSNGKEILAQCFDFDAKNVSSKPISLVFEKEKIIKRITVNKVFYLVTIVKSTGILNFYVFKDGILDKKSIDLSAKRFLDKDNRVANLWDIISASTFYEMPNTFQTISNESPPSLAFSANKRKVYAFENKLTFVMDNNRRFTQTFTVDLNDFSASTKMFTQPAYPEDAVSTDVSSYYDSNSFLLQDKIVQIKLNPDYLTISVKDTEGKELKSFRINNQEISFKNSEIYQENGSVKSLRVLDTSSQLLRKINGTNPAVSIYESNQKICMIIGGVSEMQQNSAMLLGGMYGISGALIGMAISSNYSLNNLNSYAGRKVVYINCLFDENFNHIDGEIKKTAFDTIRAFSESNENLIAPVLFKLNSNLYYGGYDKVVGNYQFYKFND